MQSSMRDYLKRWKANYKNEQEAEFQRRQDQREAQFEVRVQEEVEKRCDEELKKLVADVSKFRQWVRTQAGALPDCGVNRQQPQRQNDRSL